MIILLVSTAILAYLIIEIQSEISQKSIDTLGATLYYISNLGDIGGVIQMAVNGWQYLIPGYMIRYYQNANLTLEAITNYTIYDSLWNNCEAPKRLFENSIPVLSLINNTVEIEYTDMFTFLNQIVVHVNYM